MNYLVKLVNETYGMTEYVLLKEEDNLMVLIENKQPGFEIEGVTSMDGVCYTLAEYIAEYK